MRPSVEMYLTEGAIAFVQHGDERPRVHDSEWPGEQGYGRHASGQAVGHRAIGAETRSSLTEQGRGFGPQQRLVRGHVDQDVHHVLRERTRVVAERLRSDEAAEQALHLRARRRLDLPDARQVWLAIWPARGWRGQVRLAVTSARNVRSWMIEPLPGSQESREQHTYRRASPEHR